MYLNGTGASSTADATIWNSTYPTSTALSVGTNGLTNGNTYQYVAYCFAEIPGYSKFGSTTAPSSGEGNYVHLGFSPRYILMKASSTTSSWFVWDTVRQTYNVIGNELYSESSAAEGSATRIDVTAFGFKIRATSGTNPNVASATYIYAAFAEFPNGSNVAPAPAR
jgi:hypothetical protein